MMSCQSPPRMTRTLVEAPGTLIMIPVLLVAIAWFAFTLRGQSDTGVSADPSMTTAWP
jgi:hypothetical protein